MVAFSTELETGNSEFTPEFAGTTFNLQVTFAGMDFGDSRRKPNVVGKFTVAVALTVMCIIVLKQSPGFTSTSVVRAESLHN